MDAGRPTLSTGSRTAIFGKSLGPQRTAFRFPSASVMTALYTTDELLTSVNAADASFAIISYRQVRCKSDDFTLGTDAFLSAVSKAREAGVDAIVSKWDLVYWNTSAEAVDVTEALVAAFGLSDADRAGAMGIVDKEPLPLDAAHDH